MLVVALGLALGAGVIVPGDMFAANSRERWGCVFAVREFEHFRDHENYAFVDMGGITKCVAKRTFTVRSLTYQVVKGGPDLLLDQRKSHIRLRQSTKLPRRWRAPSFGTQIGESTYDLPDGASIYVRFRIRRGWDRPGRRLSIRTPTVLDPRGR